MNTTIEINGIEYSFATKEEVLDVVIKNIIDNEEGKISEPILRGVLSAIIGFKSELTDGKNAYELAVQEGFVGDLSDFLISIKGDKISHSWDGTILRLENPDGSMAVGVDLKGEKGDAPGHEVSDSQIRFKNPDGTWGDWVLVHPSLDSKVDKVEGKGLSINDFSDHHKTWLEELPKYLFRQRNADFKQRVLSSGGTIDSNEIEDQIDLTIFSEIFYKPIEHRVLEDWKGSQAAFDALVTLETDRKYHVLNGNEVIKTYIG